MPELPEVQTILNELENKLSDRTIQDLHCFHPRTLYRDTELSSNFFPAKITDFERRGKFILIHLDNEITIIIHLGMTGKLVLDRARQVKHNYERACFYLSGKERIHFIDIRTFGKIVLCLSKNTAKFLPELGVDPLSDDFNISYMQKTLKNHKTSIKNMLMDQKIIAGLGNIYANEILYRAKINPETPASSLTPTKISRLIKTTKSILKEALDKNGTSISDYRRIDDKKGEFQNFLQIYQKTYCPQGHPVKKLKQGGRSTYYCPICQK